MFDCICPCHSNPEMKHCDNLSCMPCCTECKHCNKNIVFGKMKRHLLDDHGIESPTAKLSENKEFTDVLKALEDLRKETKKPS